AGLATVLRFRGLSGPDHGIHAVHDLPDLALALGHRPAPAGGELDAGRAALCDLLADHPAAVAARRVRRGDLWLRRLVRRGGGLTDPRRHRLPAARQRHRQRAGCAQLPARRRHLDGGDRPDAGALDRLVLSVRRAPAARQDHGADVTARATNALIWAGLGLVLLFLYAPLVPPAIHSFAGAVAAGDPFRHYVAIFQDQRLMRAVRTSLAVGGLVALIAPLLALLAGQAVRA